MKCRSALIILPDLSPCPCVIPKGALVLLSLLSWAHTPSRRLLAAAHKDYSVAATSHQNQRGGTTAPLLLYYIVEIWCTNASYRRLVEKIVALYVRLSRDDENEEDSNSIAHQIEILIKYCKDRGITQYRSIRMTDFPVQISTARLSRNDG